jgi:tetratricopeptide (TPR) repeat protein
LAERIALTSVLVAYAFHNLFVFDNLYSYIYFFAVLALIDSQVGRPLRTFEEAPVITPVTAGTLVLPIVAALGLGLVFVVNASGIRETALLVDAISPQPGGVKKNLALFEDLTANPSFATQEVREQLVQFSLSVASNTSLPQDFREKVALFAISEAEKQVKRYPLDARSRLQLAIAYRAKPDIAASLKEILAAHELSKRKQQILIQLGVTYVDMNDFANARKAFIAAHELGPRFGDPAIYAASGEFLSGNREAGQSILSTTFGTTTVDNDFLVQVYSHTKDYPSLIALLELRLAKSAGPIESYFNLAAAQYYTGNVRKSIEVLRRALAAHPDKASEIERAIQEVEGR